MKPTDSSEHSSHPLCQSFAVGCVPDWRKSLWFSRWHFLDPSEGFRGATCCCDWGLRGLTAINAHGLAAEDPSLRCNKSLCLTQRLEEASYITRCYVTFPTTNMFGPCLALYVGSCRVEMTKGEILAAVLGTTHTHRLHIWALVCPLSPLPSFLLR